MKTLLNIKTLIINLTRDGSELNKRLLTSIELTEKNLKENKEKLKRTKKKNKLYKILKKERKKYKKEIEKLEQKLLEIEIKKQNSEGITELSKNIEILIQVRKENY